MNQQEQVITRFYTAFQQLDYRTMQSCYSSNAVFSDPVFGLLEGEELPAMWEMLCTKAKNFSLAFENIQCLDEEYATCDWLARYSFSASGRPVVNKVKAHLRIQDGLITEHTDAFNLWRWSRQALGWPGILLGWSSFMQGRIHQKAKKQLAQFMRK
ncbi:MAG TPA: nuclear transport factor 2 family protein [Chitinophagaceae bacterium]|nr:nuclear transport factor 2 family protein [Chitinophagaceae bacterium]